MSIEAMKQALEALYRIENSLAYSHPVNGDELNAAIESLSQAIATEESSATQEPVAEKVYDPEDDTAYIQYFIPHELIPVGTKFYTHPQPKAEQEPKREWVGLTDEEMKKVWYAMQNIMGWYSFQEIACAIEAKLKEKNT